MDSNVKQELIFACKAYVEERINRILSGINDLEEAIKLETKCSVGDKYETGRAMLHLEFEKLSSQLEQYKRLRKTLTLIKEQPNSKLIGFGSVVKTSAANYFLAIPAGEIKLGSQLFYAIGAGAPIAQALKGKKEGENILFNGNTIAILQVI